MLFAENSGTADILYTVGIAADSTKIKGDAEVIITQAGYSTITVPVFATVDFENIAVGNYNGGSNWTTAQAAMQPIVAENPVKAGNTSDKALKMSASGTGERWAQLNFSNTASTGNTVTGFGIAFDWCPGSHNRDNGYLGILDSAGNQFIAFYARNSGADRLMYRTGNFLGSGVVSNETLAGRAGTEVAVTAADMNKWYHIVIYINIAAETIDLSIASLTDDTVSYAISGIPFDPNADYHPAIASMRFYAHRPSGSTIDWVTYIDNLEMLREEINIPPGPPPPVNDLDYSIADRWVHFAWSPVARVTGYKLFYAKADEQYPAQPCAVQATVTVVLSGFSGGAEYKAKVIAYNENGDAKSGNEVRFTMPQIFDYEDDSVPYAYPARRMEKLDRGLVAIPVAKNAYAPGGVFLSWRYLGTDPKNIGFNIYRGAVKVNSAPITAAACYIDTAGSASSVYSLSTVINGIETDTGKTASASKYKTFVDNADWHAGYQSIALQIPPGGTTPAGDPYTYSANDASVGDVDGDGEYEIIVKWDPGNSQDNANSGYTGNTIFDCYKLDGTRLWRIDLGINIRAGAHYSPFLVYDFDGDGKAEFIVRTADGAKDGNGKIIGSASADHRNSGGHVMGANEYLTAFNGLTGAEIDTVPYDPPYSAVNWGDTYGNRGFRFLACVAYLDGVNPSAVMCRGYYAATALVAYRLVGGRLVKGNHFYSWESGNPSLYEGRGNHSITVADVDNDGRDEIIYGSMTFDSNLNPMYVTRHSSGYYGHGDAQITGVLMPWREGLQTFGVHEAPPYGLTIHDSRTGEILMSIPASGDTGRGLAVDLTLEKEGAEFWSSATGIYAMSDWSELKPFPQFGGSNRASYNFAIWFDGDVARELLDSYSNSTPTASIFKYRLNGENMSNVQFSGFLMNNGTKGTPMLQADIYGDWREEVLVRSASSSEMRIFSTTALTDVRLYTLMHNPQYRLSVAWQNVGYNQPPNVSYYLGGGMKIPRQPNITTE